jgi:nucleotide-binding universal stress UspA family protein
MFRNILIPTDGSDLAAKAVEQAVLFAKEIGAKITAVTVTEPFHFLSVRPTNSNTPRSNTRNTPRLTPKKCLVSFWMLQSWPVLFATRSTSSMNRSIRRLSKPPRQESAI